MINIQRLLFLTDFSAEATDALGYAWELTEKFDARLYLLHVIEDPTSQLYGMVSADYHALDRNAHAKTQEWLAAIHRERLAGARRFVEQTQVLLQSHQIHRMQDRRMFAQPCM